MVAVVGAGKMGLPLVAQFASHGWSVIAVDIDPVGRRVDQRGSVAHRRGARCRRPRRRGARGRTPARDAGRRGRRARGGRRRPHRAGHARRGVTPRSPLDGCRRRRDRARAARGVARHLRDHAAGRRHARPVRAAPGGGVRPDARGRPVRRVLAGTPLQRRRAPQPRHLPEARRRPRAGLDRARRGVLRLASSTRTWWRCRRPRRPSSRSSPTRPTATSTSPWPTSSPATPTGSASTSPKSSPAANSQPYSHIHQPGLGVGGHCIPVYPHFLLDRAPELELVALARRVNDGQVDVALDAVDRDARRAARAERSSSWV